MANEQGCNIVVSKFKLQSWYYSHFQVNTHEKGMKLFGLAWFYGTSTIVGYLMPNPFYTYISNIYMICKHIL